MKTGRARILEMVKDGKISIEQADELLEALENAQPNTPASASPFEPEHKPRAEVRIPRSTNGGKYNFEQMIELGKFGVSAKFVRELAEIGLTDLSFEDVIELGKFGISPKFVLEMQQLSEEFDLGELNFERIIELGKFGVSSKFVREMIETQMIDFTLPPSQWANQWAHHGPDEDQQREKLQARLEKARATLSQVKNDREREKLEKIIKVVTEKLEHERETLEKITEKVVEEIERKLSQVDSIQP